MNEETLKAATEATQRIKDQFGHPFGLKARPGVRFTLEPLHCYTLCGKLQLYLGEEFDTPKVDLEGKVYTGTMYLSFTESELKTRAYRLPPHPEEVP